MKKEGFFLPLIIVSCLSFSTSETSFCQTTYLESLSVQPSDAVFAVRPEWRAYQVTVPNNTDSITIKAVANDPEAFFELDGKSYRSGETSDPMKIDIGRNIVGFTVVSKDKKTKTDYKLKVYRSFPTPAWIKLKDSAEMIPRDSAGELVFDGRMWLFGGYTPDVINDIWVSDNGGMWEKIGTIPNDSGVNIPVNLVYKDKMWIVCNDGVLYSSPNGKKWDIINSNPPWKRRYAMGSAVFKDRMWVMGGKGAEGIQNDIWSSTDGVEWRLETAEAPWSKRQLFGMVAVYNDKIWVVGGGITVYHPFKAYTDVWYSSDGRKWEKATEEAPWPGRIWCTSAVYRNRLWLLGGFRAEPTWNNFNDVWYSSDGKTWKQFISDSVWSPRHELSAYVFEDKLWVVGGNSWPLKNDVWYLEIKGLSFLSQPVIEEFVYAKYKYTAFADFNTSSEKVRYRLLENPPWMTIDPESGVVSGVPDKPGDYRVTVEAYDGSMSAIQTYILHVITMN